MIDPHLRLPPYHAGRATPVPHREVTHAEEEQEGCHFLGEQSYLEGEVQLSEVEVDRQEQQCETRKFAKGLGLSRFHDENSTPSLPNTQGHCQDVIFRRGRRNCASFQKLPNFGSRP